MTLPAGLATISATWDDAPNDRGAVAFCRSMADRQDAKIRVAALLERVFTDHAALAVNAWYRATDTRAIVFRQGGVEVVR